MAREEIGGIMLGGDDGGSVNSSVIHVGYNMTMNEDDVANVSSAFIFRVPKRLRNLNDRFYSPQLVSIGPFHYGKKKLREMEKSKSEAVRRMQKRIQRRDPHTSVKSIVEAGIVVKDKEIRGFYGEVIAGIDPIELAWMVTRDACLIILELLINNGGRCDPSNQLFKDEVTAYDWIYDTVFTAAHQNPTMGQLCDDIFKFENQIPLWILQHLLQAQVGSIDGANRRLNEYIILMLRATLGYTTFTWFILNDFNQCAHVLETLVLAWVGNPGYYFSSQPLPLKTPSHNCIEICFANCIEPVKAISGILCKKPSLPLPSSNADTCIVHRILQVKLPTAMELSRRGVKFQAVTFDEAKSFLGYTALFFLRFDEKTSTLYLPEVSVTNVSESGIRNIMAMEISTPWRYNPKPLTQFALFMDELIDSEEDVAVLRKAGVIQGFLESNQQVADLFNSVVKGITGPMVAPATVQLICTVRLPQLARMTVYCRS